MMGDSVRILKEKLDGSTFPPVDTMSSDDNGEG
jgi:hypothetical protein